MNFTRAIHNWLKPFTASALKWPPYSRKLPPQMTPFFDTNDKDRIELALNILIHPQQFCLKAANQLRLARLLPADGGTRLLVETLRLSQAALSSPLPIPIDGVWSRRNMLPPSILPKTICKRAGLPQNIKP